jgi:hypothetical protein
MTTKAEDPIRMTLDALAADTPEEEVHERALTNRAGQPVMKDGQPITLSYVTARFVQDRLDAVVGGDRWQNSFESLPSGAVRCGIGITFNPGDPTAERTIWKYDVGVPSSIEPDKGAHSDAFKRAGVMWGIARDLYDERDDARDPAPPQPVAQAQPAPSVQQVVAGSGAPQQVNIETYDPAAAGGPADVGWVCPTHDDVKVVPGGISRKSGKPYDSFRACPVAGCDQKEPFKPR